MSIKLVYYGACRIATIIHRYILTAHVVAASAYNDPDMLDKIYRRLKAKETMVDVDVRHKSTMTMILRDRRLSYDPNELQNFMQCVRNIHLLASPFSHSPNPLARTQTHNSSHISLAQCHIRLLHRQTSLSLYLLSFAISLILPSKIMTSNEMQAKNEKEFNLDYVVQSVELIISSDSFTT